MVELQDHFGRLKPARHCLRQPEDVRCAHGRERLREGRGLVAGDLLLHGRRLLLQVGCGRSLRRDDGEVPDHGDEEEAGHYERDLGLRREAREALGHDAPLPFRMSDTIVKLMTVWLPTSCDWLVSSWTFCRSGITASRSRSRATPSCEYV